MGLRQPPDGFLKPLTAQGARWTNFYRSVDKGTGNRYSAKCGFCLCSVPGRPDKLQDHVISCRSWPIVEKNKYLEVVDTEKRPGSRKKNRPRDPKVVVPLASSSMRQNTSSLVARPPSPQRADDNHSLLLKAIIYGGLPFTFADNVYFKEFLHALSPSYNAPSSDTLRGHLFTEMFSEHLQKKRSHFPSINDYTICFDGFTDVSENSIYAYMLLTEETDHVLEIADLSAAQHSSIELKERLLSSLYRARALLDNAIACVTDSPATMVKVQSDFQVMHPNVIPIRCCLHAFNLVVKDILGFPLFVNVCKLNQALVNYFTSSYSWRKILNKWQEVKKIPHHLSTFCDTRWFSLARVCIGVATYEEGFLHCFELSDRPDYPWITDEEVRNTIMSRPHFEHNECLVEALKPIIDVIGKLKRRTTTVADVLWSFIEIYRYAKISHYKLPGLKEHILCAIGKRVKEFQDPIYFIALFLHPACKNVAMSRMMMAEKIIRAALEIAKVWHFNKHDTCLLFKELISYRNGDAPFNELRGTINRSTHDIWNQFRSTSPLLYRFATKVFAIVPHSGSCEQIFSSLGLSKSKPRNRLEVDWLNKLAQLQCDLKSEVQHTKNFCGAALTMGSLSRGDFELESPIGTEECQRETHELIDESIEVVCFENEIYEANPMEDFFDLEAFEHEISSVAFERNGEVGSDMVGQCAEDWTIDDIIAEVV
ncbi:hypothetical protein GIB67_002037 [Kingdonia uniflora]|uniref:HAT C-terminal dimerisation domain-containing protein n=1 Tax=Kingdonia uniflora TaxID=39325 RepID=A0A7J7KWA7_9MAGN|nr:hypothetical protein GIB67_002037 [Kingdonia uniflora]